MLSIYFARSISGCMKEEVCKYYNYVNRRFTLLGLEVFTPAIELDALRCDEAFKSHGYENIPTSTNHAIVERDFWFVAQSDIVFVDFEACENSQKNISIGCCMELAVASWLRKHTIVVLSKENIHNHAFVLECADVIFHTHTEAVEYLEKLVRSANPLKYKPDKNTINVLTFPTEELANIYIDAKKD